MKAKTAALVLVTLLIGGGAAAQAAPNGPISKFNDRPREEYISPRFIFDIERCLIDSPGWSPAVYRQPDKPDQVQMLWISSSDYTGGAKARLDLTKVDGGTKVVAWPSSTFLRRQELFICAPKGN